jgi:hypothetical protein
MLSAMAAGSAMGQDHRGQLPIDVPKDADVAFEVDAPASELVPFIAQLFSSDNGIPGAGSKNISIKTSLGTINLQSKDLADLLRPIKELHAVSFDGDEKDSALDHYEREFAALGMHRVVSVGGASDVLVMREGNNRGRFLAVMEKGRRVTVVRTDGMPDLGTLGQLALEKLAEAGQRAKHRVLGK